MAEKKYVYNRIKYELEYSISYNIISKTRLFKYIEKFHLQNLKGFR